MDWKELVIALFGILGSFGAWLLKGALVKIDKNTEDIHGLGARLDERISKVEISAEKQFVSKSELEKFERRMDTGFEDLKVILREISKELQGKADKP
jgi:hypothetical protein